jgi:hypothetical protein
MEVNRRFEGIGCFHHQGGRISQIIKQHEEGSKLGLLFDRGNRGNMFL